MKKEATVCTRCNEPIPEGWEYDYRGKPVHASWEDCMTIMHEKVAALQKFKDFTHDTLDIMEIPHDPPGPHKDAGCRIGQRLEWVATERKALRAIITDVVNAVKGDPEEDPRYDISWLRQQIAFVVKKHLKGLAPK